MIVLKKGVMKKILKIIGIISLIIFLISILFLIFYYRFLYIDGYRLFTKLTPINDGAEYEFSIELKSGISLEKQWKGKIPETYKGKPVTRIADEGLIHNDLDNIIIPASIKNIGEKAFYENDVKSVKFEEGSILESIGDYAFFSCGSLEYINLPESVIDLGLTSFANCSSLKSINIPLKTVELKEFLFSNSGIENILIPNNITKLCNQIFNECVFLEEINFVEGCTIEEIPKEAFLGCRSLNTISIPDSVKTIGESAFEDCENLNSVFFGQDSNLENIKEHAFEGCNLNNIEFPKSLKNIGNYAFANGKSYFIPINVEDIGYDTFSTTVMYCEAEERPANWHSHWQYAIYEPKVYWGLKKDDILQTQDFTYLINNDGIVITRYNGDNKDLIIPETINGYDVIEIGNYAFSYRMLKTLTIPDSISKINDYSFLYSDIEKVILPNSISEIGLKAFYNCVKLEEIIISENVVSIKDGAFQNCISFNKIVINSTVPPLLEEFVFYNTSEDLKIFVPAESLDVYKTAEGWSEYADIIYPIEDN